MPVHFDKVTIIGVGLIGASMGLAARKRGLFGKVTGVGRSKANLDQAVEMGAVDRYLHDSKSACRDADLVVLATPVDHILSIGAEIAPHLPEGSCVTDVGSVKQALVAGLDGVMPNGVRFVGGHPIAGSEASGAGAARGDLFEGARTILTPTQSTDPEALRRIRSLWEDVGSEVVEMDAGEHDTLLAAVSHLPHMVAYALVNVLAEMQKSRPNLSSFAAGGFKDITRIASSHPEIWQEICRMNKGNIVEMIKHFERILGNIRERVDKGDFEGLGRIFEQAREYRDTL